MSGLEKRLQEENEANKARKSAEAKAAVTSTGGRSTPLEEAPEGNVDKDSSPVKMGQAAVVVKQGISNGHLIDSEPPPYTLSPAPSALTSTSSPRAASFEAHPPTAKRRRTGDAQSGLVGLDQAGASNLKRTRWVWRTTMHGHDHTIGPIGR